MQMLARFLIGFCVVATVICFVGAFPRLTAFVAAGLVLPLFIFFPILRRRSFTFSAVVGFVVLSLLPVDISLRSGPGWPHFVRVVYGLPTARTLEAAKRGEVICGGCIVSGGEPRWLLVW